MKQSSVTIRLDGRLQKQLDRLCRQLGRSRSEIIREALRDWSDKRMLRQRDLDALKASIQKARDDIAAGRSIPLEDARRELRAHFKAMGKNGVKKRAR